MTVGEEKQNLIDLSGKWALITGSSRGIGKEIAITLAQYGCNVILHSRKISHTEIIADQIKAYDVKALQIEAELENKDQVDKMLSVIEENNINVDIVYNVAAVNSNVLDFFSTEYEEFTKIFSVNVYAIAQICNYFIPKMLKRNYGRIINVVSSVNNEPKAMVYAASKAALIKLSKEMAYAINGTNVMLNMADPGWVRTDMGTGNAPNDVKQCIAGMMLGALLDDGISGRIFRTEVYYGNSIEKTLQNEILNPKAEMPDFLQGCNNVLEKVVSVDDFYNKYYEFITSDKKKILFGGGNQVKFFIDVLEYLGCKPDAVMCTRRNELITDIKGIKLYSIDECPYSKNDSIIIVALTEQHVRSVEIQLKELGYNVLPSYSVVYTADNWKKKDGSAISEIYN